MKFSARKNFFLSVLGIAAVMGVVLYASPSRRAEMFTAAAHLRHSAKAPGARSVDKRAVAASFGRLPMQFEANEGQTDSRVRFVSRGAGYSVFLTSKEAVLSLRKEGDEVAHTGSSFAPGGARAKSGAPAQGAVIQLALEGANSNPQVTGENQLPGHVNYFIGKDASKWHTNIPTYSRVAYSSVYPGIDETFYGNQQQLEYDFTVAPGADAGQIAIRVDGAENLSLQTDGSVRLATAGSAMQLRAPVVYQASGEGKKVIASNYELTGGNEIRFHLGDYDHSQALVIDPMLVYSTFLGGSGADDILAARIDATGNFYVTGFTYSSDFPLVAPFQNTNNEAINFNQIAFVSELSAAGNNLIFSTYLGGSGLLSSGGTGDFAQGLALNPSNDDVFVAGETYSTDFPTMNAYQSLNGGGSVGAPTAFLTVLNAGGAGLVYSTYLGGNNGDGAFGVAADSAGNAYIAGATGSTNFPIIAGAPEPTYVSSSSLSEGFLSRINTTLSGTPSLTYSTFIGGTGNGNGDGDVVFSIRTDGNGNIFFGGLTGSSDLLTDAGITTAFQLTCVPCGTANSGVNGFAGAANTNPGGVGFTWLSYLGGSTGDAIEHVANDPAGDVFATGYAFSSDFPVTTGAFQTTLQNNSGGSNAFVTEFNSTGSALVYSTYLGGANANGGNGDVGFGIAIDAMDDAYVTGQTSSTDFPTANPIQSTNLATGNGATNAFVTEVNPTGTALVFSTYLGGTSNVNSVNNGDTGWGIQVDTNNDIFVAGTTGSLDFPLQSALQNGFGGVDDGFLTEISAASSTGNVTVTPTSLEFVSPAIGTPTSAQPATLMNGTTGTVTVSSIAITGTNAADFTQTNNCTTLAAAASCTINVTYLPTTSATETATMTITDNASGSPQVVMLTGQVGGFTVSANPGSLTLTAGQSGTITLTVTPTGNFSLPVALACTGAPSAATCSVSPATVTPMNGMAATATITVNTTARSLIAPPPSEPSRPMPWLPAGTLALASLLGIGFIYSKRLPMLGGTRFTRVGVLALIATLLLVGGMTACNGSGNGGGGGTPAGTYTLTVTATTGNLAPTTMVTLNVQ